MSYQGNQPYANASGQFIPLGQGDERYARLAESNVWERHQTFKRGLEFDRAYQGNVSDYGNPENARLLANAYNYRNIRSLTGSTTGPTVLEGLWGGSMVFASQGNSTNEGFQFLFRSSGDASSNYDTVLCDLSYDKFTYKGNKVWHAGNMGPGSGMNADTVDGAHLTDILKRINTTYGSTSQNPDTATEPLIVTNHASTPDKGASTWYITTIQLDSTTARRVQVATIYAGESRRFYRKLTSNSGVYEPWIRLLDSQQVQTSSTDTTAGALMTVGAFGLGLRGYIDGINIDDVLLPVGLYPVRPDQVTGTFPDVVRSYDVCTLISGANPGGFNSQLLMWGRGGSRLWHRSSTNGSSFGPWQAIWSEGNQGPDSGMNADMVDGYHAQTSRYSGTSSELMRVGAFGLGGPSFYYTGTDADTLLTSGFHYGNGTNWPGSGNHFLVVYPSHIGNSVTQVAWSFSEPHKVFTRHNTGRSTFTSWTQTDARNAETLEGSRLADIHLRMNHVLGGANADEPDTTVKPVILSNGTQTPNGTSGNKSYWFIETIVYNNATDRRAQVATQYNNATTRYYRTAQDANPYGPWIRLLDSQQVQTSVTDDRAGALLSFQGKGRGPFGLGGSAATGMELGMSGFSRDRDPGIASNVNAAIECHYDGNYGFRLAWSRSNGTKLYIQGNERGLTNLYRLWSEVDQGPGSGMDSDLLDGQHGEYYRRAIDFLDTRDHQDVPTDFSKELRAEFKRASSAGLPPIRPSGDSTYAHILSLSGWANTSSSGGYVTQASFGQGLAIRWAISATEWGSWRTFWHDGNLKVQASPTDTTAGALMAVSAFGLGSSDESMPLITDFDNRYPSGIYRFLKDTPNSPTSEGGCAFVAMRGGNVSAQMIIPFSGGGFYYRAQNSTGWGNWSRVWDAGNQGPGSGMDADTVDGIEGSRIVVKDVANQAIRAPLKISGTNEGAANTAFLEFIASNGVRTGYVGDGTKNNTDITLRSDLGRVEISDTSGTGYAWHTGNDGPGSGLDADTVDGIEGSRILRNDRREGINVNNEPDPFGVSRDNSSADNVSIYFRRRDSSLNSLFVGYIGFAGDSLRVGSDANLANSGKKIWHEGQQGPNSGMDADTVDGIEGEAIRLKADHMLTTNARAHADQISAYPVGASVMYVRSTDGWPSQAGTVLTVRPDEANAGYQEYINGLGDGGETTRYRWTRIYHASVQAWGAWDRLISASDYATIDTPGVVQRATDQTAASGVNNSYYVTPKQLGDAKPVYKKTAQLEFADGTIRRLWHYMGRPADNAWATLVCVNPFEGYAIGDVVFNWRIFDNASSTGNISVSSDASSIALPLGDHTVYVIRKQASAAADWVGINRERDWRIVLHGVWYN